MQIFTPVIKTIFSLQPRNYSANKRLDLWIKKIFFLCLNKIRNRFYTERILVHGLKIDIDELIEIIQSNNNVIESINSQKCKYLIVGVSQINNIKSIIFNKQVLVQIPRDHPKNTFAGLNIIIDPWIDGIISIEGESLENFNQQTLN